MKSKTKTAYPYWIAIAILSIILFRLLLFMPIIFTTEYSNRMLGHKAYSAQELSDFAATKDYTALYQAYYYNQAVYPEGNTDGQYAASYNIARYYHNALYYYGLRNIDNIDASPYLEEMVQCIADSNAGSFDSYTIDAMFENYR